MKNNMLRFGVLALVMFGLHMSVGCGSERDGNNGNETTEKQSKQNKKDQKTSESLSWDVPEDVDYTPPRPDTEATLNLSYSSDPNTLNPLLANDTTSSEHLHYWTMESFATRSYRNPDTWKPRLATDWEVHDNGLRYVIHLREGVQFHPVTTPTGKQIDSYEMTAYDVKFTWQAGTNPAVEAGHLRNFWKMMEEPKVIDRYTVEINWKQKYFNAKGVTLGMTILPERVYGYDENKNPISNDYSSSSFAKGFNNHWANSNTISGTGPYQLDEWEQGEGYTLKRFDGYYADEFPTPTSFHNNDKSPKKPFFAEIDYELIQNPQQQYKALLNDDILFTGLTPSQYENDLKGESLYENGTIKDIKFDYPAYRYIGWNMRRDLFKQKNVRVALTHAIPRKDIIKQVFYNYARRATGPFFFKYPAYNDNIEPYPYDLDKARKLLDKAGWDQKTGDGVRYKTIDGEKVTFEFDLMHYADSPEYAQVASIVSNRLERIGIQVSPEPTKWNEFLENLRARKFDASMLGWAMGYVSDPYQLWHSSQAGASAGSNHVGWKHDKTDDLVEKIRVTMDKTKRREMYHELHRILHEHQPYTFLWTQKQIVAYYSRLHSVGETAPSKLPVYSIRPNVNRLNWYVPADQ